MKVRCTFNSLCIVLILLIVSSCDNTTKKDIPSKNSCVVYKEKYHALYLTNCDISEIPDSIKSKDISQLVINSTKPIDFEALSLHIDLNKIISIRIDNLNQPVTNLDLAKFENLQSIGIFGGYKVDRINLINVSDSLNFLYLFAPNLTFPQFDSAFLGLTFLGYRGKSQVIPQWIETLSKLQSFTFETKQITEIKCDVCKLSDIHQFNIIDSKIKNKELYLSRMSIYPTIQKIKKCKPNLVFWDVLPPH
ncbi:MAG: hypothetical protein WC150_05600 [Bacteroidia bacterium]